MSFNPSVSMRGVVSAVDSDMPSEHGRPTLTLPLFSVGEAPAVYSTVEFGNMLKRLLYRARRGRATLTIKKLAKTINVSQSTLYAYFSGAILPPTERLDDLLDQLGALAVERRWLHEVRDELALRKSDEAVPAPLGGVNDNMESSTPPVIEISLPDGSVEVADLIDAAEVPIWDVDLAGPYEIEDIEERIRVDDGRTTASVLCSRTISATEDGVQDFRYSVECPPTGLHRLVVEAESPVTVTKVIRVTDSAYVFHFHLPEPLTIGEIATLRFSIHTSEAPNSDNPGVYGKRQFVNTKRIYLTIEFSTASAPSRVRWFAAPFPLGQFPDGYTFREDTEIAQSPSGSYEMEFDASSLPNGRIVGLVWDYHA